MTRRDPIGTLLMVGLLATLGGASRVCASTSPAAETVEDATVNGLSVGSVTQVTTGSSPLSCGTFLLTFGWGVADGKPAFETCTSGCQGGIFGGGGGADGQFTYPDDVASDGSGHLFVADNGDCLIQKFDNSGTFLTEWAEFDPVGVAVDGSGNVFVTEWDGFEVNKYDNSGLFLTRLGCYGCGGSGPGQFGYLMGVAVDGSGNVFVADPGNNRIQKFTNTLTFLTTWGSMGSGHGQFNSPEGVAVDGNGNVFVADTGNNRIQKFTNTGTFLTMWGSEGIGSGQFSSPGRVAVDGSGNVFVADSGNLGNFLAGTGNHRIQVFDNRGTFLTMWGSPGSGGGQFNLTGGVAVDGNGNVFVADTGNSRIQKFACATPPPPPMECGVVNGDPGAGSAICGGPCPPESPFCAWVPGTVTGACRCVDNPCGSIVGGACSGSLCANQNETCATAAGGTCSCQGTGAPSPTTSTTTTTSTVPVTTSTPSPTTTTTLPAGGCGSEPATATFASIDCRLVALLDRLQTTPGLGAFGPKLAQNIGKARDTEEAGAHFCAASDLQHTRQRLKQAIRDLIDYVHRLNGLAARKKLSGLRQEFIAAGEPIEANLKSLKRAVHCPADAVGLKAHLGAGL